MQSRIRKFAAPLALVFSVVGGSLSGRAIASDAGASAAASAAAIGQLPKGVQIWLSNETDHLSRAVDVSRLTSPDQNQQDPFYAPEQKNVFDLNGYWFPISRMKNI